MMLKAFQLLNPSISDDVYNSAIDEILNFEAQITNVSLVCNERPIFFFSGSWPYGQPLQGLVGHMTKLGGHKAKVNPKRSASVCEVDNCCDTDRTVYIFFESVIHSKSVYLIPKEYSL